MSIKLRTILILAILSAGSVAVVEAATVSDDFQSASGLAWGDQSGNWNRTGGSYGAANPDNFPNAYSSLPYALSEFDLNVDINAVADGGVWMHSQHTGAGSIGVLGILLVTRSNSLYWHDVTNDSNYGSSLNAAGHAGFSHVRITATNNGGSYTYRAFLDGSAVATSSYTSANFAGGQVALYSNSSQRFDNFEISASDAEIAPVPLPAAVWLLGPVALATLARRRR